MLAITPAMFTVDEGPKKTPLALTSTTRPLAFRVPKICEGFWSWKRLRAIKDEDGWDEFLTG